MSGRMRKRVIVRLAGGLGNQLFQYANGRAIARRSNAALLFDTSGLGARNVPDGLKGYTRAFDLRHFNIAGSVARPSDFPILVRSAVGRPWLRALARGCDFVLERDETRFDLRVARLRVRATAWVDGYWTCEGYFLEIADLIRSELTLKRPPEGLNSELAARIRDVEAISVHVRRGDYLAPDHRGMGALPLGFYHAAASRFLDGSVQPSFFVFSDEPDWARAHLVLPGPTTVVSHNDVEHGYEDLRLMSLCRHHIVANSTFSWWGAWLGRKPGQIVCAPARYYLNHDRPKPDIYPDTWHRI
jgi:hypothetical protein